MFPAGEKSTGGDGNLATATPGLSGSGFASTGSGKLGLGPERTVLGVSTTQWIRRGEESEEGREGTCFKGGPPAILEGFGHQNGCKRASNILSTKTVSKKAPLGSPRDAPGSSKRRPGGQMGAKRLPKELPKSMILGFG